jgi:hypothetical protein
MCLESLDCTRIARFYPLRGKVRFESEAEGFGRACSLNKRAIWCPLGGLLRLGKAVATTLIRDIASEGPVTC